MKYVFIVAMLCVFVCSPTNRSNLENLHDKQDNASTILEDLVYVDMFSPDYNTQHPLQCVVGGDFPEGKEMAFRQSESEKSVHAVFPAGVKPPDTLDGKFILYGSFQGIQNRDIYKKFKKPKENYRYFVVSTWEQKK